MGLLKRFWPLLVLFLVALLSRTLFLGRIPRGLNADEASQAYSAYSILKTGHDEWGNLLPLTSFKSLLDYKAPLQTYLMVPSIALFGLTPLSARLPSAIFGSLSLISLFFLVAELFPDLSTKINKFTLTASFVAAFVLLLTPWHFQFSRTALEAGLFAFLFPTGLLFFLKGLKQKHLLFLSAIFWGLLPYSYHSAKLFLPLFTLALLFIYRQSFKKLNLKYFLPSLLLFALLIIPAYYDFFIGNGSTRGADLLITNLNSLQQQQLNHLVAYSPLSRLSPVLAQLFHNRLTFAVDQFIKNYISYFTLSFWFTEGGREITYSILPGRGLLFLWQLPFVLLGLWLLFKTFHHTHSKLLLAWLLLAPLPAALTQEGYRPNRASSFLTLFAILTAIGFVYLLKQLKRSYHKFLYAALAIVLPLSLVFYLNDYAFAHHLKNPTAMSYGWQQALDYVALHQNDYDHIVIQGGNQAQAFVAFYLRIPPADFQAATKDWQALIQQNPHVQYLDQLETYHLNKFTFQQFHRVSDPQPNTLYLSTSHLERLQDDRRVLFTVGAPPDTVLFELFDFPQLDK